MNAPLDLDWTTANQHLLVAEFARLRARLGEGDVAEAEQQVESAANCLPSPSAIDTLVTLFELSDFERDLLLLVAGAEMDARVAALCGEAAGQPMRPWASFGLALAVLPDPHWSALTPVAPLRRWRLIEVDESAGLTAGRLRLDERVLHFIAGLNYLDHRLAALLDAVPPASLMAEAHRDIAERAADQLADQAGRLPTVMLSGDDTDGQRDVAATLAQTLGVALFALRAADIPAAPHEQASLVSLWQREAALLGAGLLIVQGDDAPSAALSRFIPQIDGLLVVSGAHAPRIDGDSLHYSVSKLDAPGQRQLWQAALGDAADTLADTLDSLASQYRLGARRIAACARQVDRSDPADAAATLHRLSRGDGTALSDMAQHIVPCATWDDLILPDAQRRTLQQLAVHARHRITVHHDWGFAGKGARGLGIATLFSGESGTGKTLAAEVLAGELGLALYRIDLSAVISKYIGETEKNLRKVFDAAEDIGALLLFDEADALFGKRSEVKDSHDRYANIEVSYLLQRMEAYRGLAILTTNHKTALDTAFQRRLRFVVHFPYPDAVQREAIWRSIFPAATPLGDLDFVKLARLNATGGNIRNIALSAAFLAAEAGTPVSMAHLLRAAHLEAAKREKSPTDAETRGWV
ncbi:ATP-binding protein [Denitromonas ohlonensis]|uniref:ATP-binding protein n=2 Tax=Denitromonas TaxID=139331 RepID=A0A557RQC1_9RHOO|nr:ATP-binding protein [Denitromonas ohlonensis]TVO67364.1 ATP-binding protein [Denitromonas ohlonensis]TVO71983.1 ATP-binding protein [Denitromonas ohlonensis]